ncbi:MAG: hypothetical protein JRN06_03415 [Nitrososphaerota archaeon]|nr:hypothetical protein [Nitrososphaerota archaeon]MDG7023093.1 hypothetical protein [Nitrososphaerota archaeon]
MSFGKTFTARRRVVKALWALVINVTVWVVVPYYIGTLLVGRVGGSPLTIPTFVYEFGALFTVLDVGAAYFDGLGACVPFLSGVAVLSAVYLWLVTNGGDLSVAASGITVALDIRLLVYIFIVPSVWAAIRAPIAYVIWRRALRGAPPVPSGHSP